MSNGNNSNDNDFYKSFFPSALTLFISLVFGFLINFLYAYFTVHPKPEISNFISLSNKMILYPVFMYAIFVFMAIRLKNKIKAFKTNSDVKKTKLDIIKMIDKNSGVVDGIGTALPLIGAALILFTVGLGEEYKDLFINVAIPFEIKSLFVLAIAKLFENVYDQLELQVANEFPDKLITENGIAELKLGDGIVKVEIVNLPDAENIDKIANIVNNYKAIVDNIRSKDFGDNLTKIKDIINK